MIAEDVIYGLLTDTFGDIVHAQFSPQNTPNPVVIYSLLDQKFTQTLRGHVNARGGVFNVDIYADTYQEMKEKTYELISEIESFTQSGISIRIDSYSDMSDKDDRRSHLIIKVWMNNPSIGPVVIPDPPEEDTSDYTFYEDYISPAMIDYYGWDNDLNEVVNVGSSGVSNKGLGTNGTINTTKYAFIDDGMNDAYINTQWYPNSTQDFMIEVVIKYSGQDTCMGAPSPYETSISLESHNYFKVTMFGLYTFINPTFSIEDGFYHYVVKWDSLGSFRIYENGQYRKTASYGESISLTNSEPFTIGFINDDMGGRYSSNDIRLFRVYTSNIPSDTDITNTYNQLLADGMCDEVVADI